jgi:pimeloyl-ACP methyl ester carboxylesterase
MSTYVLIHGAFRGGWAWRSVRPHLLAAGHDVHAPSLVGSGELSAHLDAVSGLDVWVDQIARLVKLEDLHDVVLVGHSQGGLVAASVAARIPERISTVVFLDAALPVAGQRAVDLGGVPGQLPPRTAIVPPPAVTVSVTGQSDGEYDAATAAWVAQRLRPGPVAPAFDPVPAVPDSVRQVHAFCAHTPAGYPSTHTRARLVAEGVEHLVLDAGHDAPLSAPERVADLLLQAVNDHPAARITAHPFTAPDLTAPPLTD